MSTDKDYINGFNLGFRFQKLAQNQELQEMDKAMLKSMEEVIGTITQGSEQMEGFQDGQENAKQAVSMGDNTDDIIPSLDLDNMDTTKFHDREPEQDVDFDLE